MKDGFSQALEARLNAHRRLLTALTSSLSPEEGARLLAEFDEPFPPQDGQEDPGAVPTEAFAAIAAYSAEMRSILAPLRRRREHPSS